jgi:predicted GH43/DUF377 family glycosyl hydrolase
MDDRSVATKRMEAQDVGVVLKHGDGPDGCDRLGAREAQIFTDGKRFYLHYDGAGPDGWTACLAVSDDLVNWEKRGRVLQLGKPGAPDCGSASSPWGYFEDGIWHMFYLATPNTSAAPDFVPHFPYMTLKAHAESPEGPWVKDYHIRPFLPKEDSYYDVTASPGHIIKYKGEYLQYFSSTVENKNGPGGYRTVSLARTTDLNGEWTVADEPMLPLTEQIENSSVYYEKSNGLWFLFTNHIAKHEGGREYASEARVYWSDDPLNWNPENKAVVMDRKNCTWSPRVIGMPSVLAVDGRLAVFYDGCREDTIGHMKRDIGLAWMDLPLQPPA